MQNFNSEQGDSLSAVEAQEVLKAWTNRQQAQGVDPSVGSVTSLAAGLGVSEDEVRRILEDIRVQHRSQQIAAGILQQEQKHRKRLDVTAAIGATAALCVIAFIVAAIVAFGHRSRRADVFIPAPPAPIPGAASTNVISETEADGTTTVIDQNGIHIVHPNGTTVQINDPQAINKLAAKLGEIKGREAAEKMKSQGGKLTEEQKKELNQEADIKKAMKEMTKGLDTSSDTPTPPPATPANGR